MRAFQVVLRTSMKYSNHFMFVICTWNMARITHHMMFYLFMNFLSCNASQIASFYVEKTHESPKSSCVEISNILGIERCAVKCLNTIATTYMFSVNKNQRKCLCCPDLTGSDITDPEWESFIPRKYCAILWKQNYQAMALIRAWSLFLSKFIFPFLKFTVLQ